MKTFSNRQDFVDYIINNIQYFSPNYFTAEFDLNQKIAIEVCETLAKLPFVKQFYMYDCPKCTASTGIGRLYPPQDNYYMTCSSCHYEDVSEEFSLVVYYENEYSKKKPSKQPDFLNSV